MARPHKPKKLHKLAGTYRKDRRPENEPEAGKNVLKGYGKLNKRKIPDRFGQRYYPKKAKGPAKAIRLFCFECMGWDRRYEDSGKPIDDVKQCTDTICPLFDFRFGKNPFIKRIANLEALKKARETKTTLRQSA